MVWCGKRFEDEKMYRRSHRDCRGGRRLPCRICERGLLTLIAFSLFFGKTLS